MSNSTQNDHETHTACIRRIQKEGASATCCYCNPHEDCTLHSKEIDEMEKAIDEGFVESEKAIKGMKTPFDKSAQNIKEWAGDPMYPRDFTQTDWEKHKVWAKTIANMVYGFNGSDKNNPPVKGLDGATQTLEDMLADARREGAVLARRTNKKLVEMYIQDIGESIPSELADMALMVSRQEVIRKIMQDVALMREEDGDEGYNRACNDVLATLREEETK